MRAKCFVLQCIRVHYISLQVLLMAAFILWPPCTFGCGLRFFGVHVFLCGFAVFGPSLLPLSFGRKIVFFGAGCGHETDCLVAIISLCSPKNIHTNPVESLRHSDGVRVSGISRGMRSSQSSHQNNIPFCFISIILS